MSNKEAPFDQPSSLMLTTIELLKKKDLIKLSAETEIPFYWLQKFVNLTYKNPSVNRVQFIYEHLTGDPLLNAPPICSGLEQAG